MVVQWQRLLLWLYFFIDYRYGLSLWLTKAVVKADMYHFPVIGKRLQARRDKEEAKLYEEQY